MKRFLKPLLPFCIALLLSSCGVNIEQPVDQTYLSPQDPSWQQHLSKLKQIQTYQAKGQIGYIGKKKRFSSRFEFLYQGAANYSLMLFSNLSSQTLTLRKQNNVLQIFDQSGKVYSQQEANHLLRSSVGTHFPLEQFALWLKGQPEENQQYNVGQNHLLANFSHSLQYDVWRVDYVNYHNTALPMPKDILLKSDAQTLKIRTEEWKY